MIGRLPTGVKVLAIMAAMALVALVALHLNTAGTTGTPADTGLRVQVVRSAACRIPQMPSWIHRPTTVKTEEPNYYEYGQTITYRAGPGVGLTVWDQQDWQFGVATFVGAAAVAAESAFAPVNLPGHGAILWSHDAAWSLHIGWCTRKGDYTVRIAGLAPGGAPITAALIRAWSQKPAAAYVCRSTEGRVVCNPVGTGGP